jgi:hypothetical protein
MTLVSATADADGVVPETSAVDKEVNLEAVSFKTGT